LLAMVKLSAAALRARGEILASQSLDGIAYTGVAALIVLANWLFPAISVSQMPSIAYLTGMFLVMIGGILLVRREFAGVDPVLARLGYAPGLRIAAFNGLSAFGNWIGLVLLTSAAGAAEAGIYRVAFQ